MEALLFIGGATPERKTAEPLIKGVSFVCAADSGLDTVLSWGLDPDLIVGDMDSLSDPALLSRWSESRIVRAPVDKDETDTELALGLLRKRGIGKITMIGGGGGRIDHFIALLALFERATHPDVWLFDGYRIDCVEASLEFECAKGDTVSVFPVGNDVVKVSSTGLKWKLDGLVWIRGDSGVSNVATSETVAIEVHTGRVIVVRSLLAP